MTTNTSTQPETPASAGSVAVRDLLAECRRSATAVELDRLAGLEAMIDMAADDDWELPEESCRAIYSRCEAAHASILHKQDLPASMIECMSQLHDEMNAYTEFCNFRDSNSSDGSSATRVTRIDWLESKRQEVVRPRHLRIIRKIQSMCRGLRHPVSIAEIASAENRRLINGRLADEARSVSAAWTVAPCVPTYIGKAERA